MRISEHNGNPGATLRSFIRPCTLVARERLEDGFVFVYFICLTWFFAWQRVFPYIYDDEYGVLGASAVLSGHDWSAPPGMPFYGFALSLLSVPFFVFGFEPTVVYRAVLSINGVLVALSAVFALNAIRQISFPLDSLLRVLIVIAAFSYPSVFHYSQMANGETALLFSLSLGVFSLVALIGERNERLLFGILLGASIALAPYAHSRGIVFSIAMAVVLSAAISRGVMSLKSVSVIVMTAILLSGALELVKHYLVENFYSEVRPGTGSVLEFAESKLSLLDYEKLSDIILVFVGQAAYLATSSFGLVFIGIVGAFVPLISISRVFPYHQCFTGRVGYKKIAAGSFVGLSSALMFLLSVIQMATPVRADHGRYNEVVLPWLIIVSLLWLSLFHSRLKFSRSLIMFSASTAMLILCMAVILMFPKNVFDSTTYWSTVTSWFVHIQGVWRIQPLDILIGTLVGSSFLLVALFFSPRIFVFVLILMFFSAAVHNYSLQHRGGDKAWSDFSLFGSNFAQHFAGDTFYVFRVSDSRLGNLPGEALQFALPQSRVIFESVDRLLGVDSEVFIPLAEHCASPEMLRGLRLCVENPALLDEILNAFESVSSLQQNGLTKAHATEIAFDRHLQLPLVVSGTFVRFCAAAERYFFSSWARFCLPSADIGVTIKGLLGTEDLQLGVFISDSTGKWHSEWREALDVGALSGDYATIHRVPIRFDADMPRGEYRLNAAIVDEGVWEWSTVKFIGLELR